MPGGKPRKGRGAGLGTCAAGTTAAVLTRCLCRRRRYDSACCSTCFVARRSDRRCRGLAARRRVAEIRIVIRGIHLVAAGVRAQQTGIAHRHRRGGRVAPRSAVLDRRRDCGPCRLRHPFVLGARFGIAIAGSCARAACCCRGRALLDPTLRCAARSRAASSRICRVRNSVAVGSRSSSIVSTSRTPHSREAARSNTSPRRSGAPTCRAWLPRALRATARLRQRRRGTRDR